MEKLNPCTRCPDGGKPEIISYYISGIANHLNYFARCQSCKIRTRSRKHLAGAIEDWNKQLEDSNDNLK